jgi:hypothetical protein
MLLDGAIAHVEHTYARKVVRISVAKFLTPVLPLQVCMLETHRMSDHTVSVKATVEGALVFSLSVMLEDQVSHGRGVG